MSRGLEEVPAIEIRNDAGFHWGVKAGLKDEMNKLQKKKEEKKKKEEEKKNGNEVEMKKNTVQPKEEKKEGAVVVEKKNEAQKVDKFMVLKNLNVRIKKGSFVCIIGDVGSGKSSLLSALIGDLLYLSRNDYLGIRDLIANSEEAKIVLEWRKQYTLENCPILVNEKVSYVQ